MNSSKLNGLTQDFMFATDVATIQIDEKVKIVEKG